MANPQPTDAHIRIAHTITEAIMQRDFSKRQRKILDLILRLSWGCGKKTAIIPHLNDFQLVGIGKTHISIELKWLQDSKIITIDGATYSFNKDFDQWQVSRVYPYTPEKLTELIKINLLKSYQNGNLADDESYQNSNQEVTETVTAELPKQELPSYRKGNSATSESESAKENVKETLKKDGKESTTTPLPPPAADVVEKNVYGFWVDEGFGKLTTFEAEQLKDACSTYTDAWVYDALVEAVTHNVKKWSYIEAILKNWGENGRDVSPEDLKNISPAREKFGNIVKSTDADVEDLLKQRGISRGPRRTIEEIQQELGKR